MAGLTWQDVAGQVAAPDYSEATAAITRGIESIGSSVNAIVGAPEERRKADLAAKMVAAATGQKFLDINTEKAEKDAELARRLQDRAAQQAWGQARSQLETMAYDAALNGKGIEAVLQSELYQSLAPEARALADGNIADVLRDGIRTRDARLEREQNNRIQARQLALSEASNARAARESNIRLRALQAAEQEALDLKDPFRRIRDPRQKQALRQYSNDVGALVAQTDLTPYAGKSVADILTKELGLPKDSWIGSDAGEAVSEIRNGFEEANRRLVSQGLRPLPPEAMAYAASTNAGNSNFFGTTEPTEILYNLGVARHQSTEAQMALAELKRQAERGGAVEYDENRFRPAETQAPRPQWSGPVFPRGSKF